MSTVELKNKVIWEEIFSCPLSIRRGFEKLKETAHQYKANGYTTGIKSQYDFDERFLEDFHYFISNPKCLERNFAQAGGIVYEFGLEWCKLKFSNITKKI